MADPFIGEIKMFAGTFAMRGWALCNGQLMLIAQNDALFSLITTTYGGDGVTTFGLPDLQGRVPMHQGKGHVLGESAGSETVTLTTQQLPAHTHTANASTTTGNSSVTPANNFWSTDPGGTIFSYRPGSNASMNPGAVSIAGGSQPHNNLMPLLTINFQIALEGIFPQQG